MTGRVPFVVASCAAAAAFASGCGSTEPAAFYRLRAPVIAAPESAASVRPAALLAVGPVRLPAYLEGPQLVSAAGPNALARDEFHRWAEPLADGITRAVAGGLAAEFAGGARDVVAVVPFERASGADVAVAIDVLRFEPDGGACVLEARFTFQPRGAAPHPPRSFRAQAPCGPQPPDAVAVMNDLLFELAAAIAQDARALDAFATP